jgi:large subunit ribosomal protein L10
VAKVLRDFIKEKQKIVLKVGVLGQKLILPADLERLADMPSLDTLRAQLLGLLQQPAGLFVRVINAAPQGLVNVLQARVRTAGGQ